ncbi:hypothetical protein [Streptomyces lunaelactis]|uniref:hypothetical protein n=1 Tax=Streptomyces lunaelactis TaxID=1535768 RepID=UPI001585D11C|nr:hypothetical protein [Streptomyces lunaelactis]NUL26053.1 hypothetical protein [Streptomyces lunaelactis]
MSSAIPEGLPPLHIHVLRLDEDEDDVPLTDVGVVNINGERHLFLRPQSFNSAVRQVSSAMPDLPLEQVERLVREHCPEFKDFDELLGAIVPSPHVDLPPPPAESASSARPRGRAKTWAIAAALVPALAGSWALGYFTGGGTEMTAASAPDVSPSPPAKPFVAPEFMDFSKAGQIDCTPIANLEAECTDSDGMVMSSKAATGPDSTIFTFSYGSESIGLRIFNDTAYAEIWTRQDGTAELYPNLVRSGRYVLWGTDQQRLKEYLELLRSSESNQAPNTRAMNAATPLPPRLAALTLGTLGLDEQDVRTILYAPQDSMVGEPVLLAAQTVLGVREDTPSDFEGGDDIVAIAIGIEPRGVPDTEPGTDAVTPPPVVAVTDQGTSSTTDGSGTSQDTVATPAPEPEPKPVAETPQAPDQTVEDPAPVEEQPTDTAPSEQPTEPVVEETESPADTTAPAASAEEPTDPAAPQEQESADPEQPVEEGGAAVTVPDDTASVPDLDGEEDGELLSLPQAWVAAA